ncbi:hypothetical protein LX32DRAFT_212697 [Colletotrichum zoysiae]|uniref:Uncharacterized protein n=1 Tax=Colletotrichum zoysiae TaxID=1216348 RepID=A0AAD9LVJ7_9PEZI|nr:hypothetical protein LX32DRAFT_212697 [Colletotrichum zoysiae]
MPVSSMRLRVTDGSAVLHTPHRVVFPFPSSLTLTTSTRSCLLLLFFAAIRVVLLLPNPVEGAGGYRQSLCYGAWWSDHTGARSWGLRRQERNTKDGNGQEIAMHHSESGIETRGICAQGLRCSAVQLAAAGGNYVQL